jgi:hypothetical protein
VTYPTRIPRERHENKHTQLGRVPAALSFFFKAAAGDAAAAENVASIYLFLSAALINQGGKQAAV